MTEPGLPIPDPERRLAEFLDRISDTLIRVAAGDFTAQVPRDFAGDSADALASLVNNTVAELRGRIEAAERRADEDRTRLEALVRERTRDLDRLASTDALTETFNRQRLKELGMQEVARARRFQQPLCVTTIALDGFPSIVGTFGHKVGDAALQMAAAAIRTRVRAHDHVGRHGAEEFVILLPGTAIAGARRLADSVREEIAAVELDTNDGPVTLAATVGVAEWSPDETFDELLARASSAPAVRLP